MKISIETGEKVKINIRFLWDSQLDISGQINCNFLLVSHINCSLLCVFL